MQTNFALLTDEQKTAWAKDLWRTARNQSFLMRFTGSGHNAMIQRITELTKTEKGTRAVMTLLADLTGDGIVGDYTLEGNEEEIKAYDTVIQIDQLRNANRLKGRMADQKSIVNFRKSSRDVLAYWLADRLDQLGFLTLSSLPYTLNTNGSTRPVRSVGQNLADLEFAEASPAPSANRRLHLTSAGIQEGTTGFDAADSALTAMTYADIVNLKAFAKDNYIRGVKTGNGEEVFHLFLTPVGMAQLKLDSDFIANVRHAGVRGKSNDLFAGSNSVMVDGVVVHEYRHVFDTRGAAAGSKMGTSGNDNGQRALFCGAQAMGFCDLGAAGWDEEYFDYKNQPGISINKIVGFLNPKFKGNPVNPTLLENFGVVTVDTAI